jgi:hypothetical protein
MADKIYTERFQILTLLSKEMTVVWDINHVVL